MNFHSSDKHMKDLLSKLLDSRYFESIPTPRTTVPVKEMEEVNRKSERTRHMSKGEPVKEPGGILQGSISVSLCWDKLELSTDFAWLETTSNPVQWLTCNVTDKIEPARLSALF